MRNHKELKEELKLLYSDEEITDAELNEMSENLVVFCNICEDYAARQY